MNDVLAKIVAAKKQWLQRQQRALPLVEIERELAESATARGAEPVRSESAVARGAEPVRSGSAVARGGGNSMVGSGATGAGHALSAQLHEDIAGRGVAVIAECKRASPSAGLICAEYDPAAIACAYAQAGASGVSVLTEEDHFMGSAQHMRAVAALCPRPVLCKDFIIDEWQIAYARLHGASAVLLIVALLNKDQLLKLAQAASRHGLDALVEVHDESELESALACPKAIIGINNRNLKDLSIDLNTSIRLSTLIPKQRLVVSESGISTHKSVTMLRQAGLSAFLVGEHLMRQPNPGTALTELFSLEPLNH